MQDTTVGDTPNPKRSWTRLDGVDLLRGIAIFFVLMNHVNMRLRLARIPYTHGLPDQLVSSLVWNGQRGVQMFFAISGFLITSTAIRRWSALSRVNIRDFYLLRFARIAPLLLALLLLLSILHLLRLEDFVVSSKTGGLGRALIAALTFHVNVLEATRGYLPANWDILWSLSVEEIFYLGFPLVCVLFGRSKLLVALLVAFVIAGPFGRTVLTSGNEVWKEYSYLGGMDAIALGSLTALFISTVTLSRRVKWSFITLGATLLLFSLCLSTWARSWGLERNGLSMTIVAIGTCLIVAACAQTHWQSPAAFRPLLSLGRSSYEVYLTHMFIVFAFFHLFLAAGKPLALVPLFFIAVILVSGFFGKAIAHFYSEPSNRFLRKYWGEPASRMGSMVEGRSDGCIIRR